MVKQRCCSTIRLYHITVSATVAVLFRLSSGCRMYKNNCEKCIANGCYWLPEVGACRREKSDLHAADGAFKQADFVQTCSNVRGNLFDDPLYSTMKWSYDLIRVEEVWEQGITGYGVHIRFNDNGLDANHPEFAGKFDSASCVGGYEPLDMATDHHGTATASIAAAANQNDHCAVGIAPQATISACNVFNNPSPSGEHFVDANLDRVHISSNSIGRNACHSTGFFHHHHHDRQRRLHKQGDNHCPFTDTEGFTHVCKTCNYFSDGAMALTSECEHEIEFHCSFFTGAVDAICLEYLDLFVECHYNALTFAETTALTRGISHGRKGKGIIYVFSAGNDFGIGEDVNVEGWLNSRFTITVGAVGKFGEFASYSSTGSALFIVAPGGDSEYMTNNVVAAPGGSDCQDISFGTSFACPVVSGVVALMLEVNPELGWRDVQAILASTASKTEPEDDTWITNGAGLHHSIKFGFGIVDALGAVTAAKTWENYGQEQQILGDSGQILLPIADEGSSIMPKITTKINIADNSPELDNNFMIESVVVYLDLSHASRGDLEIILTSPQGTPSVLYPGSRPDATQIKSYERWKLMTVRSWGESPFGEWSLSIQDKRPGDIEDCVDLPWILQETMTCAFFYDYGSCYCVDGRVVNPDLIDDQRLVDYDGLNPVESCCPCGGGQSAKDVVDVLKSWKLVVYGHSSSLLVPPTSSPTYSSTSPPSTLVLLPQELSSLRNSSKTSTSSLPAFTSTDAPTTANSTLDILIACPKKAHPRIGQTSSTDSVYRPAVSLLLFLNAMILLLT